MRKDYRQRTAEIDPTGMEVKLSPEVRQAFEDLSAAVHFSDQVEHDSKSILKDWATRGSDSARGFVASLASIAPEIFKHIHKNNDDRAADAWAAVTDALVNHGFTLAKVRQKTK